MKYAKFLAFLMGGLIWVSCSDDDDNDDDPNPQTPSYTVPDNYTFVDENGNSTVDYSGQTDRLNQLEQITVLMKSANTPGNAVSAEALKAMYANEGGNGGGNFDFTSTKELKDKTASAFDDADDITAQFETWMDELAAISSTTVANEFDGSNGVAGVVRTNNSGPYLMNANGEEYVQYIEKGLMGAVFYHQMTYVYLSDDKIGNQVDNTTPVDPANGKYYTTMEHHWDEAFGYFSTDINFPDNTNKTFWAKYCNTVNAELGTNQKIMNAFLRGRAAIANGDMATKDEMRDLIRVEMEKVAAGTAIHYLNSAVEKFTDDAARNHVLSEAVAFLRALRYGPNPSIPVAQINALENDLTENGFYDISIATITTVRDEIGTYMGFTAPQVTNL